LHFQKPFYILAPIKVIATVASVKTSEALKTFISTAGTLRAVRVVFNEIMSGVNPPPAPINESIRATVKAEISPFVSILKRPAAILSKKTPDSVAMFIEI